jgi:hypothetical protein
MKGYVQLTIFSAKIISRRITVISDSSLNEEQNGFRRRRRSYMDRIFTTEQFWKDRQCNIKTYLLFVDYVKTFDSVLQTNKLWKNNE